MENLQTFDSILKNWLISIEEKITEEVTNRVLERIGKEIANDKIYDASEICKINKITIATLNRWVKNGLRYTSTGKRTKRFFTVQDVEKYKKENKTKR